ncbi:DUF1631 family protein [Rhodoferax saidenbachensis]|uniref:Thymidine phosphorylase n=1 Tax=Rhodoferax saidenbachensis TaxID=1484693 RepID=A0A1P8KBN3_9BURK|nr:DUF1631 family protein [Rhodoferax saidenbachensis]APW43346.1 hypothetical protein RS694_12945 [Rhodoferax saidenbachensis]
MNAIPSPAEPLSGPQSRALAQRLVRAMVGKTLTFFADHQVAFLKQVRAQLLDRADGKPSLLQGQHLRSAAVLLDRQADAFLRGFGQTLQQCVNEEVRAAFPQLENLSAQTTAKSDDLDGLTLSLIDVDEVHRILLLDRISQPFNAVYEASLTPLSQRLSVLFAADSASLSSNPFRPAIFLKAFMNAWVEGKFDEEATEDLMQTLVPEHSIDLAPLYKDLLAVLAMAGVQARTEQHRIRKAPNSSMAPLSSKPAPLESQPAPLSRNDSGYASLQSQAPQSAWGGLAPVGRTIAAQVATQARAFLQRLGVGIGGSSANASRAMPLGDDAGYAPDAQPAAVQQAADPVFLNYLQNIQDGTDASSAYQFSDDENIHNHNVLRQMRDREEVRNAPELDRGTVDALAEVFDYVFADLAIPLQMKMVIGRLQIPVLKAAMIDRDFFLSGDHPARKLVDTLASASVAWAPEKGENDPLYVRIEHTVQRVLKEFEDDLDLFSNLLVEFSEFLFETEQQVERQIEPVATQERNVESLADARAQADEAIHARISALPAGLTLAPFLTPFLTTQWREVVALALLRKDTEHGAGDAALKTMDALIWSTQPKTTAEDRRQLVDVLPEMIRNLNAGLDDMAWDGDPRAKFTRRLINTHMLAIRMKAPAPQDSQAASLEEAESKQAITALDERRASKLAFGIDAFDEAAHQLARGLWFEISEAPAAAYRCKLSWVSPMRTRFLFTNREGHDAFVRSEREVAAMLRMGTLQQLDQAPIISRALDKLMADSEGQNQLAA